jgi:hypothetical protein
MRKDKTMETGIYDAPSHFSYLSIKSFNRHESKDTVTIEIATHWDKDGLQWLRDKLGEVMEELDKPKSKWTHAVFNGDCSPAYLTSGKLYPIYNVKEGSDFNLLDNNGYVRFCLTEDCAHLDGGNWTLVSL